MVELPTITLSFPDRSLVMQGADFPFDVRNDTVCPYWQQSKPAPVLKP